MKYARLRWAAQLCLYFI